MTIARQALLALACAQLLATAAPANAQPFAPNPGRDLVAANCFRCHTDAMFRDQRQDRRSWEATIYRMVGRGGLWTQDEIKLMAEYLGNDLGPNVRPTPP
jgi:mono/diheme cytochrome c family protein